MGDERPPPCPDWFAWWLKHEFRPFQRSVHKQLTVKKVVVETAKPVVTVLLTIAATHFPQLKALIGAIGP